MSSKVQAKPNLNGNTPQDFVEAGRKLYDIAHRAKQEINEALSEILHGRNYQHSPSATSLEHDKARLRRINAALDDLGVIGAEIYAAGEEAVVVYCRAVLAYGEES